MKSLTLRSIAIVALLFSLTACNSFVPREKRTEVKKGERVTLTVTNKATKNASAEFAFAPLAIALAPKAIDLAIKAVEKEIKREAARYKASYNAYTAETGFYLSPELNSEIALDTIELERTVLVPNDDKSSDDNFKNETALLIKFKVVTSSDNTYFRLVPHRVLYQHAKAKTRKGDDDLDLSLTIRFHSFSFDSKGAPIATVHELTPMEIKSLKLPTDWTFDPQDRKSTQHFFAKLSSSWVARLPRPLVEKDGGRRVKQVFDPETGQMVNLTKPDPQNAQGPRINEYETFDLYGAGVYAIEMIVQEQDEFGDKVESVQTYVSENKEDWTKKAVEQIKEWLE